MNKPLNLKLGNNDVLIIADIQNDFLPGGSLPIEEGDQVIPVLNDYIQIFKNAKAKIIASRDWHPPNHVSFKAQGGQWPPHCVQNTEGAKLHPDLKLPEGTTIISKATDPVKEAYSVFDGTGLADMLKAQEICRVFIGGVATDYCIVNSVLDARKMGFEAVVLADGTRGINVKPGDVEKAIDAMMKSGASQITLADFPEPEALTGEESASEIIGDQPLTEVDLKKKARMRPKGSYKRIRSEKG